MKLKKQFALVITMLLLPLAASADDSGSCGDNVTYTYVEATQTLTISGTGDMKNYDSYSPQTAPWYSYSSSIKTAIIEDGVTSIGGSAFHDCRSLTTVTIPNSVTNIGEYTFWGCWGLTSVTIPNSVTSIGEYAFSGCSGLTSVTIPNSVTSIEFGAFNSTGWYDNQPDALLYLDNWLLGYKWTRPSGEMVIKEGTRGIASRAFDGCMTLTSVTIPNSVTIIGEYAFEGCSGLASITIPNSVTRIGDWAFNWCLDLTSVTIGNSVTSIGDNAFSMCTDLTSLSFGNSVKSIGKSAFSDCESLTSVTIPNSVTSIGNSAFAGCEKLTEVRSKIKKPFAINGSTFQYYDSKTRQTIFTTATLYVPNGTKELYQATEGWKNFANIVESDELSSIEGDLNGDDEVDVTDVVELIDMVLAGTYDAAGDINGDNEVDVTDVVELIDMVLSGE